MASNPTTDGSAAAAILHPLERTLSAALLEHDEAAKRAHRATGPLSRARACLHALARFLLRDGAPAEVEERYAADLAARALKGRAWCRFRQLEADGMGAHEALHTALNEVACAETNAQAFHRQGADHRRARAAADDDTVTLPAEPRPITGEMAARCLGEAIEHLTQLHEVLVSEASRAHLLSTGGNQFDDERRNLRAAIQFIEAIRRAGYEVKS